MAAAVVVEPRWSATTKGDGGTSDQPGLGRPASLAVSLRGCQGAGPADWLCAQGAGPAVSFCVQGAGPAVDSRQPDAQRYWPRSPGPALAVPPPRWRRQPPAHKSGGFAACESAQPAQSAAPPADGRDLKSVDSVPARCCRPEASLLPTCGQPALMMSYRLPVPPPGMSLVSPACPKLHRPAWPGPRLEPASSRTSAAMSPVQPRNLGRVGRASSELGGNAACQQESARLMGSAGNAPVRRRTVEGRKSHPSEVMQHAVAGS